MACAVPDSLGEVADHCDDAPSPIDAGQAEYVDGRHPPIDEHHREELSYQGDVAEDLDRALPRLLRVALLLQAVAHLRLGVLGQIKDANLRILRKDPQGEHRAVIEGRAESLPVGFVRLAPGDPDTLRADA